ncbi:MAG: hypothetical protein JXB30_11200 [Anaerolineae bacterium]|nr:hypothetical protein [Anaerolineae bacterium]
MNLPAELTNPPSEYSVIPFWFWNDVLNEREIIRQIDDFERHGVSGFVIHPRVGLPRNLAWMSEPLLGFYAIALKEAQRRGMKVLLYDEGMYPSGSSCGQVVATNPEFQCRCLDKVDHLSGTAYQLKEGENLVAVVTGRNGRQASIIDRKADSVIRGLHYIGEGPEEDEPPAGDLLNPEAVDCFIDLVYRRLFDRFSAYFGETIIGVFTDEPSMLGRCREENVFPGTKGILEQINAILGYDFTPYLAALWSDDAQEAAKYQEIYLSACEHLLAKTYYARLSSFCRECGTQLTGHPGKADDIGALRHFDIPGQDLIWRWVLPDHPSALERGESTQGKCSSSAMIHAGKRRNLNECCGAYGHELSWEEMVWLANWCMIRGVNMLVPHAFYYSMRGCRKDERPPDVGPNAVWWPRYREYADAVRRLCWINTDSKHVCHVAILGKHNLLPWRAAKVCFENQIDFNYIEEGTLLDAEVTTDGIRLAGMAYRALIVELEEDDKVTAAVRTLESANRVIRYTEGSDETRLVASLREIVPDDVSVWPHHPGLRTRHVTKDGIHYFMLFNETKEAVEPIVKLPVSGETYLFDLKTGAAEACSLEEALSFEGHEMKVIVASMDVGLIKL